MIAFVAWQGLISLLIAGNAAVFFRFAFGMPVRNWFALAGYAIGFCVLNGLYVLVGKRLMTRVRNRSEKPEIAELFIATTSDEARRLK